MNTNEELKTRPDFDEIAKDQVRSKNFPFAHPGTEYLREGINYGCNHVWTTHVEPLQSENQKLREQLKEANDAIKELEKFDER